MKIKFFVVFLLISVNTYSQDYSLTELLPRDKNDKIYFSEVVTTDGLSKDVLYQNSRVFFADVFKSSNNVIQLDDKEKGILIGKGFSNVYAKASVRDGIYIILDYTATVQMWFSIKIQFKDGRYKYEIYDVYFIGNSEYADNNKSYSGEYIFNKNRLAKKSSTENLLKCKSAVENEIKTIISSLKTSLRVSKTDEF